MRDHLLRLDPEDRLLRFGGCVSDGQIETYCDRLDRGRAVVIGYLVEGGVRGLGELVPMAEGCSGAAEAALSVEGPYYRNRGIGTELLRRLIVVARNRSVRSLHMLCLPANGKVVRMARRLGAKLAFDRGAVEGRLALAWPNHLTLLLELLADATTPFAILPRAGAVPAAAASGPIAPRDPAIPPAEARKRAPRGRSARGSAGWRRTDGRPAR